MRQMRQISNSFNNLLTDPFGFGMFGMPAIAGNMALMPHRPGFSTSGMGMPNMNRLLSSANNGTGVSYSSSSVYCMSSGGSGQPQIYKETSSTRVGPGGVRETRQTVEGNNSHE